VEEDKVRKLRFRQLSVLSKIDGEINALKHLTEKTMKDLTQSQKFIAPREVFDNMLFLIEDMAETIRGYPQSRE
jgi:hypothetical protein